MTTPEIPDVKGQTLVDLANGFLGGYQNATDSSVLLTMLNEGKNEVWMILKSLRADWFMTSSQNSDGSKNNFFDKMSTSSRQYALPKDFHEMKFLEVLDSGYEDTEFIYRDMASSVWKDLRRSNTNSPSDTSNLQLHYDIIGKNQMILAEYPPFAFNMTLWYVRMIPDFGPGDVIDEIIYPYSSKIAMYAAKVLMLALQDKEMYAVWKEEWKDAVMRIAMSASPRQISDTIYVEDFTGTPADSISG